MLNTEPSFSIYHTDEELLGEIKNGDFDAEEMMKKGNEIEGVGTADFTFGSGAMGLIDEGDDELKYEALMERDEEVEEYYKMMIEKNPSNPLFLRKYAQLLQFKGDLSGAEEQLFLATLADPKYGDTLMQYAKLVWELYHDRERAYSYFKRAVIAAPEDSNVLGAYAKFLWEIDDGDDQSKEERQGDEEDQSGAAQVVPNDGEIISEYAKFVWNNNHDKDKASFYFKRAMQASPEDSNVLAAYASFLWQAEDGDDDADAP